MPKRLGFDVEFDNDEELLFVELEFTDDDNKIEFVFKNI